MPINPNYNFLNVDAPLDDKNQFLDFLQRDAQAKGMDSNYVGDLRNTQETMNVLGQQQAPRPAQPMQAPRPNIGMQQVRNMPEMAPTPMPEIPEQPEQTPAPMSAAQGMQGIGNFEELPMGGTNILPPEEPMQTRILPPQEPALPQGFENTEIAKRGQAMGMDPRQILVALAEFSAGMGNIKGKPQQSTARSFYEMQKKYEQQNRQNAMGDLQMAQRAMTGVKTLDPLKQEYTRAQTENLQQKTAEHRDLADPNSPRSVALKQALEVYMQKSMGVPNWKAKPELTGNDVYKWMQPLTFAIGQKGQMDRLGMSDELQLMQKEDAFERQLELEKQRQKGREELQNKRLAHQRETQARSAGERPQLRNEPNSSVMGFEKVADVGARPLEVEKLRSSAATFKTLIDKIDRYKNLIKKHGPYENPYSAAGAEMESLAVEIQLEAKNPDFFALGVLTGPDLKMLESVIMNSSKIGNILLPSESAQAKLDSFKNNLERKLTDKAASLGFRRAKPLEETTIPQTPGSSVRREWKP
jgi:hypothetical protein